MDEAYIATISFNNGSKIGKNRECEANIFSSIDYLDYLNTTASAYPAFQIDERSNNILLNNFFNLYTFEKTLELQG